MIPRSICHSRIIQSPEVISAKVKKHRYYMMWVFLIRQPEVKLHFCNLLAMWLLSKFLTYLYPSLLTFKIKIVISRNLHHWGNAWLTAQICFPLSCSLHSPLEKGQWIYNFISDIQFCAIVDYVFMVSTHNECVFQKSMSWKLNLWTHRLMVFKSKVFRSNWDWM